MTASQEGQVDQEIKVRLFQWRAEKLQAFDEASLVWLAAVPAWTERLGEVAGFPFAPFASLAKFLERAETHGIAERDPVDHRPDLVLGSVRAMMALWPRLSDTVRPQCAPVLRQRAEMLPPGPEQRRILRETDLWKPAADSAVQSTVKRFFSRSTESGEPQPGGDPALFEAALADLKESGGQALSLRVVQSAAAVLGPRTAGMLLSALSEIQPASALRALAPMMSVVSQQSGVREFILQTASGIDPEERAYLYLYLASNCPADLRRELQGLAFACTQSIADAVSRARALAGAIPDLSGDLRSPAVAEALRAASMVESPAIRVQVMASLLPFLPPGGGQDTIATVATLARQLTDPAPRTAALAAVGRALAARGEIGAVASLAASAGGAAARAQILLEALPAGQEKILEALNPALAETPPSELEQTLLALSPESGAAVARFLPTVAMQAAGRALLAGALATSARIGAFYPERDRSPIADELLKRLQALPSLRERLDAICEVAAYLPSASMGRAWQIASQFETAVGFSAAEPLRSHQLEFVTDKKGSAFVRDAAQAAGAGIMKAAKAAIDVPAATARWATIAELAKDAPRAAVLLTNQIRAAIERANPGEALDILCIAEPFARIVGAELEPAMAMGRQAIQLVYRQQADERHLLRYLPRKEQNDAFTELITGPPDRWALHYLGMGGVGKTMLLRYVTARLAVTNGVKLPSTRVDFDHISPDFPVRKPGELLASLAEELRFFGGSDQDRRYSDFMLQVGAVHGKLSGEPPPERPLQNIERPEFDRLLNLFAALLSDLPKPVIFILDTCEELAKLEPAGSLLPSVEATFQILERLQKMIDLRVVFAGRRLLAQAGDQAPDGTYRWEAASGSLSERNKLLPLAKKYLRLHVVRGFTAGEAKNFFSNVAQIKLDLKRKAAILRSSCEAGESAEIVWHGVPAPPKRVRFNPFDVSLYAEWLREKPSVTAETIRSRETDPYVQARIVDRIRDGSVRSALPAAILLRRFDLDMLRPMVADEDELRRVYRDLGGQSWIDYQQNALQIHRNLLERVERYYRHESRRHLLDGAAQNLGPALAKQVRDALGAADPFAGLSVAKIDATLRLLPGAGAAAIWDEIDRKVTDRANWSWAFNVCRFLISEQNAAGADNSPLRAAVRATMTAAALHAAVFDPATLQRWWQEIDRTATAHPIPSIGHWLALRAKLALGPAQLELVLATEEMRSDGWRYEQLAAAVVASLERQWVPGAAIEVFSLARLESALPLEIRAFAACLVADSRSLGLARDLAGAAGPSTSIQRWADWRAPHLVRDRVRLELLRAGREGLEDRELEQWGLEAAATLDNIDSERLLARIVERRLDFGVPALPDVAGRAIYDAARKPNCEAHRDAPVLFAVMAEALLAAGDAADAERLLATPIAEQDSEAGTVVRLGRARLSRIMRRPDALALTREALAIEQPQCTDFHRWWATQSALDTEDRAKLVDAAERQVASGWRRADGTLDPHSALDALELDMLGNRLGRETDHAGPLLDEARKSQVPFSFPVRVRQFALTDAAQFPSAATEPRRAAEMTLAEGELLALRLPDMAAQLFSQAEQLFSQAGDPFGEFRALVCAAFAALTPEATEPHDRLRHIEEAYGRCRERAPELPSWESIGPDTIHPWPGWALRIARLKAWAAEPRGGRLTDLAQAALRQTYGLTPQFERSSTGKPGPAVEAPQKLWPLYLIVGLVTVALVVWAGVSGIRWLTTNPSVLGGALVGIFEVVIIGYLGLLWILPWVNRAVYRVYHWRLLVQTAPDPQQVSFVFEMDSRDIWPFGTIQHTPQPVTVPRPGSASYAGIGSGFLAVLKGRTFFRGISKIPVFTRMPMMAIVERRLAKYPWEAPLNMGLSRGWLAEPLQVVRPGNPLATPVLGMVSWKTAGVAAYSRSGLSPLLEASWRLMPPPVRAFAVTPSSSPDALSLRVIHIVGTVAPTASTPQFLFGKTGSSDAPAAVDLAAFPKGAAIVVVQEEPAERIRRLDVDRDQTAETRNWAFQLFDSGVQTVVFLPALPLALARTVVERIARRLRGKRPLSFFALLNLVTDLQNQIRSFQPPAAKPGLPDLRAGMAKPEFKQALRELSLEITLFTRSPDAPVANRFTGFSS